MHKNNGNGEVVLEIFHCFVVSLFHGAMELWFHGSAAAAAPESPSKEMNGWRL